MAAVPPPHPVNPQDPGLCDRVRAHAYERAVALEGADATGRRPVPDPDPDFLRKVIMAVPDLHELCCREYDRQFDALRALRDATPLVGLKPIFRLQVGDLLTLIAHVYRIPKRELVERRFNRYRHHLMQVYQVTPTAARVPLVAKAFREEPPGLIVPERERFAPILRAMDDLCARGYLPAGELVLVFDP